MMMTPGIAEKYSTTVRNRIRELRTKMIPLRFKQAREASLQGRWQDEVHLWEDLLVLEPSTQDLASHLKVPLTLGKEKEISNLTQSIQERLQIARQNEQCAWMYAGAQQFIKNKDTTAARTQLQMLWQDAPFYGDSAGLAQNVGLPAVWNTEQIIAAEQARLEQERHEQERQEQWRQTQASAKRKRDRHLLITVALVVATVLILGSGILGGILGGGILGGLVGKITGALLGAILGGILWGGMIGGDRRIDKQVGEIVGENIMIAIAGVGILGGILGGGILGGGAGGILGGGAGGIAGALLVGVGMAIGAILEIVLALLLGGIIIGITGGAILGGAIPGAILGAILGVIIRRIVRRVY
jgi:hypothetical protein